jgi:hypothetical protein
MATYSVHVTQGGVDVEGATVTLGDKGQQTTNASGVASATLAAFAGPLALQLVVTDSAFAWGGGVVLQPGVAYDVEV